MKYLRLPSVVTWHAPLHPTQDQSGRADIRPVSGDRAWALQQIKAFEARRTILAGEGDKQMGFVNAYVLRSEQTESQRWYSERTNLLAAVEALRLAKEAYKVRFVMKPPFLLRTCMRICSTRFQTL
jgi:hypothetical protein